MSQVLIKHVRPHVWKYTDFYVPVNNSDIFLEFWFLSYYECAQVQAEAFAILWSVKGARFIARD